MRPLGRLQRGAECRDIALGYQQLLHVERGWRDLTAHLELRPRSTTAANTASARTCPLLAGPAAGALHRDPYRPHLGRRPRGPDRPGRRLHPGPANPPPPPAVLPALEITPTRKVLRLDPTPSWARRGPHLQVLPA